MRLRDFGGTIRCFAVVDLMVTGLSKFLALAQEIFECLMIPALTWSVPSGQHQITGSPFHTHHSGLGFDPSNIMLIKNYCMLLNLHGKCTTDTRLKRTQAVLNIATRFIGTTAHFYPLSHSGCVSVYGTSPGLVSISRWLNSQSVAQAAPAAVPISKAG